MSEKLNREQLILLVEQLRQAAVTQEGAVTQEQADELLNAIDRSVPAPAGSVSDLFTAGTRP